jgi:hypothetical protein
MRFVVALSKVGNMATKNSKVGEICCNAFKSRENGKIFRQ